MSTLVICVVLFIIRPFIRHRCTQQTYCEQIEARKKTFDISLNGVLFNLKTLRLSICLFLHLFLFDSMDVFNRAIKMITENIWNGMKKVSEEMSLEKPVRFYSLKCDWLECMHCFKSKSLEKYDYFDGFHQVNSILVTFFLVIKLI